MQPTKAPAFCSNAPDGLLWTEFPSLLSIFEVGYIDPSPAFPLRLGRFDTDTTALAGTLGNSAVGG